MDIYTQKRIEKVINTIADEGIGCLSIAKDYAAKGNDRMKVQYEEFAKGIAYAVGDLCTEFKMEFPAALESA